MWKQSLVMKANGTESIIKNLMRIKILPNLTGIFLTVPGTFTFASFAAMTFPSVESISNFKFIANLSDVMFGIAPKSSKAYACSECAVKITSWCLLGGMISSSSSHDKFSDDLIIVLLSTFYKPSR